MAIMSQKKGVSASMDLLDGVTLLKEPSLTPFQAAELEKQSLPERIRTRRGGKTVRRWGDEVSAEER